MKKSNTFRLFLLLIMVSISACRKTVSRNNEITHIELGTGWCFGPCQFSAISIDSSLQYQYYGGKLLPGKWRPTLQGYYTGKISKAFWDTLNVKLEKINYQKLDTVYPEISDARQFEIIIHYRHKVKHIHPQSGCWPDSVQNVFNWLADSYKQIKLKPSKDSLQFETVIQTPRRLRRAEKNLGK